MKNTITVNVTAEDIEKGKRDSCQNCPIALALGRLINPAIVIAQVAMNTVDFHTSDMKFTGITQLPTIAIQFIFDFDNGGIVSPFSFNLDINPKYLK